MARKLRFFHDQVSVLYSIELDEVIKPEISLSVVNGGGHQVRTHLVGT